MKPLDNTVYDEGEKTINAFLKDAGHKQRTVRVLLEVPLSYLDFDKCHCEPDSIGGECEGVPFSDPCWDVDLTGLEYVGAPVEIYEPDREQAEEYLIEIKKGRL